MPFAPPSLTLCHSSTFDKEIMKRPFAEVRPELDRDGALRDFYVVEPIEDSESFTDVVTLW